MPIVDLLSRPAWQGVGALVAVLALLLYMWFEIGRRRRRREFKSNSPNNASAGIGQLNSPVDFADHPIIRYFSFADRANAQSFYDELIRCINNTTESIHRTGHGFHHERRSSYFQDILRAERHALARGVEIVRIQTGTQVAPSWAEGYASMLEDFDNFKVVFDFDNVLFGDIGLLDPHGHNPVIYFLFESRELTAAGMQTRPTMAVFMKDARSLANLLGRQFVERANKLEVLTPQDIRDLSKSYIYFGWGIHMASRKLLRDIPDARPLGVAILRGWKRDVAAMLAGPAVRATIHQTGNDSDVVHGVAYELSWWAKTRLDRLERRAYEPVAVPIQLRTVTREAFTYVMLPPSATDQPTSPDSWIDLVIEGAIEYKMKDLLSELRAAGAPASQMPEGTL